MQMDGKRKSSTFNKYPMHVKCELSITKALIRDRRESYPKSAITNYQVAKTQLKYLAWNLTKAYMKMYDVLTLIIIADKDLNKSKTEDEIKNHIIDDS